APGYGMDTEFDVDAALGEGVVEFAHFMLRLRYSHSVARNDDNLVRGGEDSSGLFGRGAADGTSFLLAGGGGLLLAKCAEEHVGEGAIHRFRHIDGKNEAGGAVQRAGNDKELAIEHEAHGRRGKTGVRIQKGNY